MNIKNYLKKEYLYQVILILLLLFQTTIDKYHPHFHIHEFIFFLNYIIAANVINYILLPKYFYQKKQLQFWIYTIIIIGISALLEEFILERVLLSDSRGDIINLFGSLYDILPTVGILVGYKFAWDSVDKQNKINQLGKVISESQLQFLNSQISPHFLFNNLNNLYSYALEKSSKTEEIILELSSILRYMLYECKEPLIPLSKEALYLKHYINLHKIQLEDRGRLIFNNNIGAENGSISPLLLIVFVENAFKHSMSSQVNEIDIEINMKIIDERLYFSCKNSFTKSTNTTELAGGIGLENTKKRLDLLYPDNHQLTIEEKENTYYIELIIPINHD